MKFYISGFLWFKSMTCLDTSCLASGTVFLLRMTVVLGNSALRGKNVLLADQIDCRAQSSLPPCVARQSVTSSLL